MNKPSEYVMTARDVAHALGIDVSGVYRIPEFQAHSFRVPGKRQRVIRRERFKELLDQWEGERS
jgi:hypothetical protein